MCLFDLHIIPWSDLFTSDESDRCSSRGDETAGILAACSLARLWLAYVGFRGPCWLNLRRGLTSSLSQHLLGIVPAAGRQLPLVMARCNRFTLNAVIRTCPFDLRIFPWSGLSGSDESDRCATRGDETARMLAACSLARLLLAYVGFRDHAGSTRDVV